MQLQFDPYALPLLVSASLAIVLVVLAWRRRPTTGASAIALLMAAMVLWCITYALELLSADIASKQLWIKGEYIAIVSIPVLWIVFVLQYTGREHLLTRRNLLLLCIMPVMTVLLVWTNAWHGLIHRNVAIDTSLGYALLTITYGPFFWLHGCYTYALILVAALLLLRNTLSGTRLQRAQSSLLLIAVLIPVVGNVIYVLRVGPTPLIDLTPILFTVAGMLAVVSLFRFRLLDITPVARDMLIEGMTDGVVVIDSQYRAIDLNPAAKEMLGVTARETIGLPVDAILPLQPQSFNGSRANSSAHIEAVLGRSGRFVDLQVSPLKPDSRRSRGWLVVMRDISDRKRAEQAERNQRNFVDALRHASAALTNTLSLDEVLDHIMDEIKLVIPHDACRVLLVEGDVATVARSHDYAEHDPSGWHANHRFTISDTENLRLMFQTRQPLAIPDTRAFPGWVRTPEAEWLRSFAGAPMVVKGQVIGFLNLDSAVPGFYTQEQAQRLQAFADQASIALENARLYSSLQETNAELEFALQSREEMIQNVSHELRTPLTLVMGYIELLMGQQIGDLNTDQVSALGVMLQQSQRLHFMVNSLLALQSFNPDKLALEPVFLDRWLPQVVGPWQRIAQETGHPIHAVYEEPLGPANVATSFLELVIGNLLDNAIKFSPHGGAIEVTAHRSDDSAVIAIADHGIGIAPDKLDRIFDRFFQVDGTSTRRFGGIGIGLALCQAIVQAHGGHIQAESAGVGHGATFRVTLPLPHTIEIAD